MSRRALTEDWTIELDDALHGEVIDGSLRFASAGPPTRTIWIAAWNPPATDDPATTIAWARDTAARTGPPVAQSQVFEERGADGEELRYARWYYEPNASPAHWALYAYTARRGGLVQAAFLVDDAAGQGWALEAWRSLRHRSTAIAPPQAPPVLVPPAPASAPPAPVPMPAVAPPAEPVAMPQVAPPAADAVAMPVVVPVVAPAGAAGAEPAPADPPTLAAFVPDAPDVAPDAAADPAADVVPDAAPDAAPGASAEAAQDPFPLIPPSAEPTTAAEPAPSAEPTPAAEPAPAVTAAPPFVPPIPAPSDAPTERPDPLSASTPLSALTGEVPVVAAAQEPQSVESGDPAQQAPPEHPLPPQSAPPLIPPIPAPPAGPPAPPAPLTLAQRAEDSLRARQDAWRQLGQLDEEQIAHVAAAPGVPAETAPWPTERQGFVRVRRGPWTILASDGLSDASSEASPLGLGIEVFVEVDDPALTGPMSAVPANWATSLLRQGAQAVAKNGRPMVEWLAANRVGSIEFSGVPVPPAFQARGAQGEPVVGALIGLLPFALPYQIALPAGPIRLLPITLLTARETDYVRAAGAAGREWLAGALANAGPAHRSTLARQSLI